MGRSVETVGNNVIYFDFSYDDDYPDLAEHWLSQVWDGLQQIVDGHVSILHRLGTMNNGVGVFRKK